MSELLLELFSEEIPARMQAQAAEDLKRLVTEKLITAGLEFQHTEAHSTPRRLSLVVQGLPLKQKDVTEERKGPRVGSPETAIQGFLKGAGLSSLNQAEKRQTDKGEFYFATLKKKGRPTKDVLADILQEVIPTLPWPKSMRWNEKSFRWVRPLHSVLALFQGKVIKFNIAGVSSGDKTQGHRFLSSGVFSVKDFDDYARKLRKNFVILGREERKAVIWQQAAALAKKEGLFLREDPALLEEVAGLVEWPLMLIGAIDSHFMDVPDAILISAMRTHQKYFSLKTKDGKFAPHFLVTANQITKDKGKTIVAGNERVLRARLSDAKFFWDQDCTKPLESLVPALNKITFHEKLGSMGDKVRRIEELAVALLKYIPRADEPLVRHAARLAKADLVTGVVGEFPELQGYVGRFLAQKQGADEEVAAAIQDHYRPLGPSDLCPTNPVSIAVALADKIDTLVGFFSIGEKPTGSRDPYALRRAALGVIRLIRENTLRIPLRTFLKKDDLLSFFADRLKVALKEEGVRHDLIDSVFALGNEDDLVRLLHRVRALEGFLRTDDGANLLIAYRRASNIVKIEEKKDSKTYNNNPDPTLFQQEEEKQLNAALLQTETKMADILKKADLEFTGAMNALAALRQPVDLFFDKVTVNAQDPKVRVNRLCLLSNIRATMNQVADFSKVEE